MIATFRHYWIEPRLTVNDEDVRAAGKRLAAECPIRLSPLLHRCGKCVHYLAEDSGRICHYARPKDAPAGLEPSPAQLTLWAALAAGGG